MEKDRKELVDKVLKSIEEGNIVFITEEGFFESPIEEFVQQPLDGMLYDLNRNEAVIRTDANKDSGWRWVHDLSLIKLLEYYYNKANQNG